MKEFTKDYVINTIANKNIKVMDVSNTFLDTNVPTYLNSILWKDNVVLYVKRNEINDKTLNTFDTQHDVYVFYMDQCVAFYNNVTDESSQTLLSLLD